MSAWSTLQTWIAWWVQKAFYKDLTPALAYMHSDPPSGKIYKCQHSKSHNLWWSTAGPVLNMHIARVDAWMYQFSSAWQRSLAHCLRHLPVRPMCTLELSTQRMGYTQFLCTFLLRLDHLRAPASGGGQNTTFTSRGSGCIRLPQKDHWLASVRVAFGLVFSVSLLLPGKVRLQMKPEG